jgi:uncharacterized protein (TIGR02300 family)
MGKPELGIKCTCAGCHERFYDLNRSPAICPKCGAQQPPEKPRVLRPQRTTFGGELQARKPPVAAAVDDDVEPAPAPDVDDEEEEEEEDVPESSDDVDDDVEIDPDLHKAAD